MDYNDLISILTSEKTVIIIGTVIMIHVVLAVHELGHLVVGLAQGFRFELWVVGLLGVKRAGEGINFYLNTNLMLYGGVTSVLPKDFSEKIPDKFANMVLAGPVASLLFSVTCFLIAGYCNEPIKFLGILGGATSLGIVLATTLPNKTGVFFTDRKKYQRLKFNGMERDIEVAMLKIIGQYSKDNSYKNISPDDIALLLKDHDSFIRFYGAFNMICYQIELNGNADESDLSQYASFSKNMNKSIVRAFDTEIINQQNRFNMKHLTQ